MAHVIRRSDRCCCRLGGSRPRRGAREGLGLSSIIRCSRPVAWAVVFHLNDRCGLGASSRGSVNRGQSHSTRVWARDQALKQLVW